MEEGDIDYKTIHQLKLHEEYFPVMKWGIRYHVTRVPGGWIYQGINRPIKEEGKDYYLTAVFVPFNKEFK